MVVSEMDLRWEPYRDWGSWFTDVMIYTRPEVKTDLVVKYDPCCRKFYKSYGETAINIRTMDWYIDLSRGSFRSNQLSVALPIGILDIPKCLHRGLVNRCQLLHDTWEEKQRGTCISLMQGRRM